MTKKEIEEYLIRSASSLPLHANFWTVHPVRKPALKRSYINNDNGSPQPDLMYKPISTFFKLSINGKSK
jgi:hypothetical protein